MFKISILPEEIENMPLGNFPGKIQVIDKTGFDFLRAVAYLRSQEVIGFDTETRPVFSPGHHHNHVALLQLSGPKKAFLFRVGKMGIPRLLARILSDPQILKIGAAVHDDVCGLQYYRRFEERGFVDLQKIAFEWGIRDKSVKKLAANILGVRISKSQQLSNWEADALSAPQQMYAATDAWICREMYLKLLKSEKHPLTPEQLNPPQAQQPASAQAAEPGRTQESAAKKRRRRRRRAKSKTAEGAAPAEAGRPQAGACEEAAADKPKPKHRRRHRRPKKVQAEGQSDD